MTALQVSEPAPHRRRISLGRPTVSDLVAGLVAGLFSIPEGMAYAMLGGFNPVLGLYAGIVPTMVGAMSTGTMLMVTTLTSAIALSSASALEQAGLEPTNTGAVFTLTVLVGIIMALVGLLHLGALTSFVSNAVMTGFVTGIAVAIIVGVLGDFSGYSPVGADKPAKVLDWLVHVDQWKPEVVAVGVITVLLALVFKRIKQTESLSTIIVLLLMTAGVYLLKIPVELVGHIATVPRSLPTLTVPELSLMPSLALGALSVSLVALAQAAGIGAEVPNPDGSKSDQNRDFIGQGLANLAGGLFQALPAGGSLSRTGVATSAGARSRRAGIFAGIWLAVIVVAVGPLTEFIPMAVIGGLLFVVAGEIIAGKIHDIRLIFETSVPSAEALVATFLLTMVVPLQYAILLGVLLSILQYSTQSARQVRLASVARDEQGQWSEQPVPAALTANQPLALVYGGGGFFAEVPRLKELVPRTNGATNAVVMLGMREHRAEPSTFLKWLEKYAQELRAGGNLLMLVGVEPELMKILERSGAVAEIGQENIFPVQPAIFGAAEAAQTAALAWIARNTPNA